MVNYYLISCGGLLWQHLYGNVASTSLYLLGKPSLCDWLPLEWGKCDSGEFRNLLRVTCARRTSIPLEEKEDKRGRETRQRNRRRRTWIAISSHGVQLGSVITYLHILKLLPFDCGSVRTGWKKFPAGNFSRREVTFFHQGIPDKGTLTIKDHLVESPSLYSSLRVSFPMWSLENRRDQEGLSTDLVSSRPVTEKSGPRECFVVEKWLKWIVI